MVDNKQLAPGGYHVVKELRDKIRYLLDTFDLYDEGGLFTFPDGDTWTGQSVPKAIDPDDPRYVNAMPSVGGKRFFCECGCGVFTHGTVTDIFACNACPNEYRGVKE